MRQTCENCTVEKILCQSHFRHEPPDVVCTQTLNRIPNLDNFWCIHYKPDIIANLVNFFRRAR